MQKDKGILAVVPAWGGSKAVNLKDLRPVLRVPVVVRVGEVVAQVPMIAGVVVSPADAPTP